MNTVSKMVSHFNRRVFRRVTNNRLVYNTCWEDPRIDRQLLQMDKGSSVLMISSAGCNALDYLLDNPATIQCVDINPAQNALLSFKKALFSLGNYELLWRLFGKGSSNNILEVYHSEIRPLLPDKYHTFWDANIDYFSQTSTSFFYHGTSGLIAKLIVIYFHGKQLEKAIHLLLQSQSLAEQQYYFEEIKPYLSTSFTRWLLNSKAVLSCLGVPEQQLKLIDESNNNGLQSFVLNALENVFTSREIGDNYFWHVYLTGSYSKNCCPNYLKENNFEKIRHRINRVDVQNCSVRNFLKQSTNRYSQFVLLDHQDWLAGSNDPKLWEEWKLILKNSQPGARILFRSASAERSFIPGFVNEYVTFEDAKTEHLHKQDRVGTYGSTHLAIVHTPL